MPTRADIARCKTMDKWIDTKPIIQMLRFGIVLYETKSVETGKYEHGSVVEATLITNPVESTRPRAARRGHCPCALRHPGITSE
jgi:hypothetical protein